MRIDPYSDRPLYKQLADILRAQIQAGRLEPGQLLPALPVLQDEHGVGRGTARQAVAVLRSEGLVVTIAGLGSIVRAVPHTESVELLPGDLVTTRMPTPEERREYGLPEGVPVFQVEHSDGTTTVHAGDRTTLRAPEGG